MKNFRFRLERVLEWRRTQLELEQARLQHQMKELLELDSARANIEAAGISAEIEVRGWHPLTGSDLTALAAFRRHVIGKEKQIDGRREEARRRLDVRKAAMIEARRRSELLERLKQRRLAEWQAAAARELEELAAQSYLARFTTRGRPSNTSAAGRELMRKELG
jgi:hypothetical protein